MKRLLMVGPFEKPVTGMTVANEMLYNHLKEEYKVDKINTIFKDSFENKDNQGKFNLKKFVYILKDILSQLNLYFKNKYDIIYITPGQSFLGLSRFFPIILVNYFYKNRKIFLHIHGSKLRDMYDNQRTVIKKIISILLSSTTGIIVLGDSLRPMLFGIIPEDKIIIIKNAVKNEVSANEREVLDKIKRFETDEIINVIFLSNLMEEKGIIELLKATEYFSEQNVIFNLAGELEPKVKEKVSFYINEYPNKIKYHGFVNEISKKNFLLNSHLFILPSKDEGQPISILEAYANGCAVMTDENVGGIKDIFTDKVNGFSCDSNDYMTIVKGIRNFGTYKDSMLQNYNLYETTYREKDFIGRIQYVFKNK